MKVSCHIWISDTTYESVTLKVGWVGTGWPRLIGCLKLQVIFRKTAMNYRALLRKMTYKDKAFCGSLLPWEAVHACIVYEWVIRMYECVGGGSARVYCMWISYTLVWMCHAKDRFRRVQCLTCKRDVLTEEIRFQIFGFEDLTIFSFDFWSDRDSDYTRETLWKFGDSREIVFNMYGDSGENWSEILAVVIMWSPISSVCGLAPMNMSCCMWMRHVTYECVAYECVVYYMHECVVCYASCHIWMRRVWMRRAHDK